jgi:hypothetical protein
MKAEEVSLKIELLLSLLTMMRRLKRTRRTAKMIPKIRIIWSSLALAHAIRDGRIVALAELIGVEAISIAFGHHSFPISVGRKRSTTTVVPFGQLSLTLELLDVFFFLDALVSHLDGVGHECGKFFIFHNISFPFV